MDNNIVSSSSEKNTNKSKNTVSSVEKLFKIIDIIADKGDEMGSSEIGAILNESRSTVHRFLLTLVKCGYLKQNPKTKKYYLSSKFLGLAHSSINKARFIEKISPIMMMLAKQLSSTIILFMIEGTAVYNAHTISPNTLELKNPSYVGVKIIPYANSSGKIALAYADPEILDNYMKNTIFTPLTQNTIIDKNILLEELQKVRKNGYAIALKESRETICSISFPIFNSSGNIFASLSIATKPENFEKIYTDANIKEMKAAIESLYK